MVLNILNEIILLYDIKRHMLNIIMVAIDKLGLNKLYLMLVIHDYDLFYRNNIFLFRVCMGRLKTFDNIISYS